MISAISWCWQSSLYSVDKNTIFLSFAHRAPRRASMCVVSCKICCLTNVFRDLHKYVVNTHAKSRRCNSLKAQTIPFRWLHCGSHSTRDYLHSNKNSRIGGHKTSSSFTGASRSKLGFGCNLKNWLRSYKCFIFSFVTLSVC